MVFFSSAVDNESSKKNLWLFNVTNDPEEKHDLSRKRPGLVKDILDLLAQVNSTAVPAYFPPKDPEANPKLHGGVWGPWV